MQGMKLIFLKNFFYSFVNHFKCLIDVTNLLNGNVTNNCVKTAVDQIMPKYLKNEGSI